MITEQVLSTLVLFVVTWLLSWSVHDCWDSWKEKRKPQETKDSFQYDRESICIEWEMRLKRWEQELAEEKRLARMELEEATRIREQAERDIAKHRNIASKARAELTGARQRFKRKLAQMNSKARAAS